MIQESKDDIKLDYHDCYGKDAMMLVLPAFDTLPGSNCTMIYPGLQVFLDREEWHGYRRRLQLV